MVYLRNSINKLSVLFILTLIVYAGYFIQFNYRALSLPEPELNPLELPLDDPLQRNPVISEAKEKLNWSPLVELNQGLDNTIDYFKNL